MSDFQAVVLAGGHGNRMQALTGEDEQKSLLPLAGIPLFWYPLHVLSRNNITDVLLITNAYCRDRIAELLNNGSLPELPGLKIDVVAPTDEDEELGTADVLRLFAGRIKRDFILVAGDFVSDITLNEMIKFHYANNSVCTCLLSDAACKSAAPGPKEGQSYRDYIGICEGTNQLVYLQPEEELELDKDGNIELDASVFLNMENIELTSSYTDCHVYIMDRRILRIIESEDEISYVKAELIPFLLQRQNLRDDLGILGLFERSKLQQLAYELQHGIDVEPPPAFRLFGYKTTADVTKLVGKCNTLGSYLETNKAIMEMKTPLLPLFAEQAKYPGTKVNVLKSRIGKETKIGEKAVNIVKSAIGENCDISSENKIDECILMDGVNVASGCQLKRCIIGRGVRIGEGVKLDNCIIQAGFVIEPKTNAKQEFLRQEKEVDIGEF